MLVRYLLLTLSRPRFLSLKLSKEVANLTPPPPPLRISRIKNKFHLKICRTLDQCITKMFLPKWLIMTSFFDDVIRFSEKGMLFLGVLFMTFLFFFLDFAYKLVFFRSVNIRYYLKIWSNGAPNRH